MKKSKIIICIILSVLTFFSSLLAACTPQIPGSDDKGDETKPSTPTPTNITLKGMQTEFEYGEEFSAKGLTVEVTMSDNTTKIAAGREYSIDYSAYNSQVAGTYEIIVKLSGTQISAKYSVTVKEEPIQEPEWKDDGSLKILAIGNSFSDDMMEYVWQIATSLGVKEVVLGNLYIGGCSIDTHVYNAKNNSPSYDYRTNSNGTWTTTPNFRMGDAIESENWDFISLQQASGSSGITTTYSQLNDLIKYVKSKSDNAKLVWHMTWAYQNNSTHADFPKYNNNQQTMYDAIVTAVDSQIVPTDAFDIVIPNGTAIQNARTSFLGDTLTRDGYHLTLDVGRYIAGLTAVQALTGLSVENVPFSPANVNADYRTVAIESAQNAIAQPFSVTTSEYTEKPTFNPNGYVLLDLDYIKFAYYNSTDKSQFDTPIAKANNSNQFYTTARLTKSQLPVGSVILLEEGWQYRPEGWTDNAPQTTRPDNVSVYRVDVTEDWWGNYIYRAFNVAKSGNPSLASEDEQTVENAMKIYVPEKLYVAPTDPDFENDYTLLEFVLFKGFYNATDSNSPTDIIDDDASLSNKFFTTVRFTKETLPVGSIIVLEEGWQYRPESWVSDEKQNYRPNNTTQHITIITEEWWYGLQYRALNLSKLGLPSLTGQESAAATALKIYIPKTN